MQKWRRRCAPISSVAMKRESVALGVAIALVAPACRVAGVPQGPSALIFAGSAIAGAAVYRHATGGCWAACNSGWVCNVETGRCEPEARERQRRLLRRDAKSADAADTAEPADLDEVAPASAPR